MKISKYTVMAGFALLVGKSSYAQTIKNTVSDTITNGDSDLYPLLKLFNVSYDLLSPIEFTATVDGQEVRKGTAEGGSLLAYGSFFIVTKPKHIVSITQYFNRENISVNNNELYAQGKTDYTFTNNTTSLNYTYRSMLDKRPWITTASLSVTTSDFKHLDKLSGIVSSTVVFQNHKRTRYTLGLAIIADLSTATPVFPVVSYWHQFKNPVWELNAVLPKEVYIRRKTNWHGWFSAGGELISKKYFLYDLQGTTNTYENRITEIQYGIKYEQLFLKDFMLSVGGGYRNIAQNNLIQVYEPNKDRIGEITYHGGWYANFGLSYVIQSNTKKSKK